MTPSPENGFEGISIPNYTLFHIPDYYSTNTYSVITPERCPKDEINSFNDTVSSIIDKNENNDYLEQQKDCVGIQSKQIECNSRGKTNYSNLTKSVRGAR